MRKPPLGPEGTIWFGGPVDRFSITLRIYGEDLDPDRISALLGCPPTSSERKGVPVEIARGGIRMPKRGRWLLEIESDQCDEDDDVGDGVKKLLAGLPSDPALWESLTKKYKVDIFCSIYLATDNRGFGISPEVSKMLADRSLEIGFDIYFDPPA